MKNPGCLVSWTKEGVKKKGIVYRKRQTDELMKSKRYLVTIVDVDFKPTGEEIIKSTSSLTITGFVD